MTPAEPRTEPRTGPAPQRVTVAIATFRRPDRLALALDSIARAAERAGEAWQVGVVLVDDDPDGSARPVATAYADTFAGGCAYVSCGSRNISVARNAGLDAAVPTADWVGSIDDDVTVPEGWFEAFGGAVADGRHHAVTGPLLKDFSQGPAWLTQEPFEHLGRLAGVDGEDAFVCATGNNWMRGAFLREHPDLRFSPDLGTTGGEDMEFFYRAVARGLAPVYCLPGAVTEKEPPARCTLRYQVRRAFWLGVSEAQIGLRLGLVTRVRLLARNARRAANRGARQLPADALSRRGVRYTVAVWAQCLGAGLGSLGLTLDHT